MLNSNDIIKREYENFKRAFVVNARDVYELVVKTFNRCTLTDLMEYMVDDKLVKSKVTFLKLFNGTRECFDIVDVDQDAGKRELVVVNVWPDKMNGVNNENN